MKLIFILPSLCCPIYIFEFLNMPSLKKYITLLRTKSLLLSYWKTSYVSMWWERRITNRFRQKQILTHTQNSAASLHNAIHHFSHCTYHMYTLITKEMEAWLVSSYTGALKEQPLHHIFQLNPVAVADAIPSVCACVLTLLSEKKWHAVQSNCTVICGEPRWED